MAASGFKIFLVCFLLILMFMSIGALIYFVMLPSPGNKSDVKEPPADPPEE
jgi:hypothetical protein